MIWEPWGKTESNWTVSTESDLESQIRVLRPLLNHPVSFIDWSSLSRTGPRFMFWTKIEGKLVNWYVSVVPLSGLCQTDTVSAWRSWQIITTAAKACSVNLRCLKFCQLFVLRKCKEIECLYMQTNFCDKLSELNDEERLKPLHYEIA